MANLCSSSGCVELAGFLEDFGKTVRESVRAAAGRAIQQVAAVHRRYVLSGQQESITSSRRRAAGKGCESVNRAMPTLNAKSAPAGRIGPGGVCDIEVTIREFSFFVAWNLA